MAFFRGSAILLLMGMGGARLVITLAFPNNGGGRTSRGFLSSHQRPSFAGAATIPSFLHSPDHPPTTLAAAAQRLEPHSESSSPKSNNNNNNTTKNDDLSKWARRTARKRQQVGALLDEILETLVPETWKDDDKDDKQPLLPGGLPWWNEIPVLMSESPRGMDPSVDWIRSSQPNHSTSNQTHHSTLSSHSKDDTSHRRRHQRALRKQYAVEAFVQVVHQILAPTDPSWQPCDGPDQPSKSILPNNHRNHHHNHNKTRIVVDACSGAGNLALPLIQHCCVQHPDGETTRAVASQVLAIDVNDRALQQLQHRYRYQQKEQPNKDPPNSDPIRQTTPNKSFSSSSTTTTTTTRVPELQTWCADLASVTLPDEAALVCSLHACGAASDLALWLATRHGLPFVISPCCTAKALTVRPDPKNLGSTPTTRTTPSDTNHNDDKETTKELDIAATQRKRRWMPPPPPPPLDQDLMMVWDTKASRQRSAAPSELIHYPRSRWLRTTLEQVMNRTTDSGAENLLGTTQTSARTVEDQYALLAKVADVGLGPQTPQEQRIHQQQAKWIIECDRLVHVVEEHDYHVQLWRIRGHEGYGKAELLVGIPSSPH